MKTRLIVIILTLLFSFSTELPARIINIPEDQETIQAGIDASEDGDTVLVQPGTYVENIDFNGNNIVVASLMLTTDDEAYIDSTIIDGDANGHSVVVFRDMRRTTSHLTGFTIRNGSTDYGGGVYIRTSDPTLSYLKVIDNEVTNNGGGIYCTYVAEPVITNTLIHNNSANCGGGLATHDAASPTVENTVISGNFAASEGGGIRCLAAALIMDNVNLIDNETDGYGGGVHCSRATDRIVYEKGIVSGNQASLAAGIYGDHSEIELFKISVANNGNERCHNAMDFSTGSILIVSCTIVDNTECIIGIVSDDSFQMVNCIVRGHEEQELDIGDESSVSYCDIEGGYEGDGNIDEDPLFIDAENGDYHLSGDSPCIDSGDPESPRNPDSTRADMGAFFFYQGGFLFGQVLDASDRSPIDDAFVKTTFCDTVFTAEDGRWTIEHVPVGDFEITSGKAGFIDSTLIEFTVEQFDTLEINFRLLHAEFDISEGDFEEFLEPDSAVQLDFQLVNRGNGTLEWCTERKLTGEFANEPWELRRSYEIGEIVDSRRLQGVAFVDDHFYVSARLDEPPNMIYVFNRDGEHVRSFEQCGESPSGMRDLAWDGELLWGSGERNIYGFTPDGEACDTIVGRPSVCSAIAYDYDREWIWVSSITSDIYAYDRAGNLQATLDRKRFRIYGFFYDSDDPDGYQLFILSNDGDHIIRINKMNVETGDTIFVKQLGEEDNARLNGAFIVDGFDPLSSVFLSIQRTDPDVLTVFHLESNVSWMALNHNEGQLHPERQAELTLTLNATDLIPTLYEGELLFNHNAQGGQTHLPVVLTVVDPNYLSENLAGSPSEFGIIGTCPNPFNSSIRISYSLESNGQGSLRLYDISGRNIATLVRGVLPAGNRETTYDASSLPSGLYILKLETKNSANVRKVICIK